MLRINKSLSLLAESNLSLGDFWDQVDSFVIFFVLFLRSSCHLTAHNILLGERSVVEVCKWNWLGVLNLQEHFSRWFGIHINARIQGRMSHSSNDQCYSCQVWVVLMLWLINESTGKCSMRKEPRSVEHNTLGEPYSMRKVHDLFFFFPLCFLISVRLILHSDFSFCSPASLLTIGQIRVICWEHRTHRSNLVQIHTRFKVSISQRY